jgi:hypothetical protein
MKRYQLIIIIALFLASFYATASDTTIVESVDVKSSTCFALSHMSGKHTSSWDYAARLRNSTPDMARIARIEWNLNSTIAGDVYSKLECNKQLMIVVPSTYITIAKQFINRI